MSDYYKSKNADTAWQAMRSKFKKPKDEEQKEEPSTDYFSKIKEKLTGRTASETATDEREKMPNVIEERKKKGKFGLFEK